MNPWDNLINTVNTLDYDSILYIISSSDFQARLLPIKIVFLTFSAVLFGLILFTQSKISYLRWLFISDMQQFVQMRPQSKKRLTRQWEKIVSRLDTGLEADYKLAIIEADDLMRDSLSKMGHDGQTLGEQLDKLNSTVLPNIKELQAANLLRDNIVHDPDFRVSLEKAREVVEVYGRSFRDLQILEK